MTNSANEHCARVGKNETVCEENECVAYYTYNQHHCEANDKTYFLIWGGGFLLFAALMCGLIGIVSFCIACYFRWEEQKRKTPAVILVSVEEGKIQQAPVHRVSRGSSAIRSKIAAGD